MMYVWELFFQAFLHVFAFLRHILLFFILIPQIHRSSEEEFANEAIHSLIRENAIGMKAKINSFRRDADDRREWDHVIDHWSDGYDKRSEFGLSGVRPGQADHCSVPAVKKVLNLFGVENRWRIHAGHQSPSSQCFMPNSLCRVQSPHLIHIYSSKLMIVRLRFKCFVLL